MHRMSVVSLDLCCPNCGQFYENPKVLGCGHSLCNHCVADLETKRYSHKAASETFVKCPTCNKKSLVPSDGLPTNFDLDRLLTASQQTQVTVKLPELSPENQKCIEIIKILQSKVTESQESVDESSKVMSHVFENIATETKNILENVENSGKDSEFVDSIQGIVDSFAKTVDNSCEKICACAREVETELKTGFQEFFGQVQAELAKPKTESVAASEENLLQVPEPPFGHRKRSSTASIKDWFRPRSWYCPTEEPSLEPLNRTNRILLLGGVGSRDSYEYYDPCQPISDEVPLILPNGRESHVAGILGDKVMVAGGRLKTAFKTKTTDLLDLDSGSWTRGAEMCTGRTHACAAVIENDQLLVMGGWGKASCEVFQMEWGSWLSSASMPRAVTYGTAAAVGNQVYVLGGCNTTTDLKPSRLVHVYDAATDKWSSSRSMKEKRECLSSAVLYGCLFVSGGRHKSASGLKSCERWDTRTKQWQTIAQMNQGRSMHAMVNCAEKLYVLGGWEWGARKSVELYEARMDKWVTVAPMHTAREQFTALSIV